MEEAPARNVRNTLAAETIRRYNITGMIPRVQAIQDGTDKEMDERLQNIMMFAGKVEIAQFRVFSCISGSLTQFGLAGKSGSVS